MHYEYTNSNVVDIRIYNGTPFHIYSTSDEASTIIPHAGDDVPGLITFCEDGQSANTKINSNARQAFEELGVKLEDLEQTDILGHQFDMLKQLEELGFQTCSTTFKDAKGRKHKVIAFSHIECDVINGCEDLESFIYIQGDFRDYFDGSDYAWKTANAGECGYGHGNQKIYRDAEKSIKEFQNSISGNFTVEVPFAVKVLTDEYGDEGGEFTIIFGANKHCSVTHAVSNKKEADELVAYYKELGAECEVVDHQRTR